MKCLVYTCVFDSYDHVFRPLVDEENLDYVIITDNPDLKVKGWRTIAVEFARFRNARTANRYYKALIHREMPGYDCSIYVDGNVRLLGKTSEVLDKFASSQACLGLFAHPRRNTVQDEVVRCLELNKIAHPESLNAELARYQDEGFLDDMGLFEATVLLKNHSHPELDRAMGLWYELFEQYGNRDQFSLPYVLWKTKVPFIKQEFSFRDPNSFFGLYTHLGDRRAPRFFAYVEGRSYDSFFYNRILKLWKLKWFIMRGFRRIFGIS